MHIRPIQKTDNEEIAKVIREVLLEMGVPKVGTAYADKELDAMQEAYANSRSNYFVVESEGVLLGGAGIAPLKGEDPSVCELQKMYFLPQARGIGMGHQMIQLCLNFAKEHNFTLCYIETMPNMLAAQKLYKKMGFSYIDHAMGCTGHTSCPVWMTKQLI
jgi:putative acetyltransferase